MKNILSKLLCTQMITYDLQQIELDVITTIAQSIDITKSKVFKNRLNSVFSNKYIVNGEAHLLDHTYSGDDWTFVDCNAISGGNLGIKGGALYLMNNGTASLVNNDYTFVSCYGGGNSRYFYALASSGALYRISKTNYSFVVLVANNVTDFIGDAYRTNGGVNYYCLYISNGNLYAETLDSSNNITTLTVSTAGDLVGISSAHTGAFEAAYYVLAYGASGLYLIKDDMTISKIDNSENWTKVYGNAYYGFALGIKDGKLYSIKTDSNGTATITKLSDLSCSDIGGGFGNNSGDYGYAILDDSLYSVTGNGVITLIDSTKKYVAIGGVCYGWTQGWGKCYAISAPKY